MVKGSKGYLYALRDIVPDRETYVFKALGIFIKKITTHLCSIKLTTF